MSKRVITPSSDTTPSINLPKPTFHIRPKPFSNEIGHLGAIHALPYTNPKPSLLSLKMNKLRVIPEGPHKAVHTSQPPTESQPKKPLSIKVPESPVPSQKPLASQLKNLSTRHSDLVPEPKTQPLMPASGIVVPNHDPAKCSVKRNGIVRAYAANTNQGLVRNYNEDRVSIILNILRPPSRQDESWPKCSFFGIYDGHGGSVCADYLRDNLHQFVIKEPTFPWNPREALRKGFENAEKRFLELAQADGNVTERSGSCAVVTLIVGDMCYIANVGDSRAILSGEGGSRVYALTRDHKPSDESERKRIVEAGGQIYQATAPAALLKAAAGQGELIVGPHRVLPGRLSVCRTFGDAEAKLPPTGNPKVVVAVPEIKSFKIADAHDFIIMGSDGIFDKLSNKEAVQCAWNSLKQQRANSIHQQCGIAADTVLKNALFRKSLDNVTTLVIGFTNYKKHLKEASGTKITSMEDKENQSRNSNKLENLTKKREESAEQKRKMREPEVISKIVARSTKAAGHKHFDFAGALERMEAKRAACIY